MLQKNNVCMLSGNIVTGKGSFKILKRPKCPGGKAPRPPRDQKIVGLDKKRRKICGNFAMLLFINLI
jgi:hypothetical protein